jgi:glycine/D-amino acid oxidase-like deaminating enzyme
LTLSYRAIVIGGGVVGCSILYHLARAGWKDVALCERRDLTAGATWHSSGHISCYTKSRKLTEFGLYTRSMLRPIETETGQDVGLKDIGSIRLAKNAEAMEEFASFARSAIGRASGARMITMEEVASLWPLMEPGGAVGAMFLEADCHLNAADFTQALAKGARTRGATILRNTEVISIDQQADGSWRLETNDEPLTCETPITASGIFARRTLPSLGIKIPCATVSHQYLVTEPVDEVRARKAAGLKPPPILREPSLGMNVREEGDGLFISLYEQNTKAIFPKGPPGDFGMELFDPDFESIEAGFEGAMARVPCLAHAGIKSVVHGPMPWSPDFAPIVGPVAGTTNLWVAESASYGVIWSGGIGRALSNWIIEGDPGEDVSLIDCRRFGDYATPDWADDRAVRIYQGVYGDPSADKKGPRVTGIRDLLQGAGARFEEIAGWDVATRFKPSAGGAGTSPLQIGGPYLLEPMPMTTLLVDGADARPFLEHVFRAPMPDGIGATAHFPLLSPKGIVTSIYWVVVLGRGAFRLVSQSPLSERECDRLRRLADPYTDIHIEDRTTEECRLLLLVPEARRAAPSDEERVLGRLPDTRNKASLTTTDHGDQCVLRLAPVLGFNQFLFLHPARSHLEMFLKLSRFVSGNRGSLIGVDDHDQLLAFAGKPVLGRMVGEECDIDGLALPSPIGFDQATPATPRHLVHLRFVSIENTELVGSELLVDQGGQPVGHLTYAKRESENGEWSAFGLLNAGVEMPRIPGLDATCIETRRVKPI